ncbi:hypothetical protein WJX73_002743 [Symbiochloris irregularis]|uniref:Uncharacterized protein n=1 Tax=Symbiochloris irregularis TaxID=706552 RepID=A0AAW1PMB0_9CHLO
MPSSAAIILCSKAAASIGELLACLQDKQQAGLQPRSSACWLERLQHKLVTRSKGYLQSSGALLSVMQMDRAAIQNVLRRRALAHKTILSGKVAAKSVMQEVPGRQPAVIFSTQSSRFAIFSRPHGISVFNAQDGSKLWERHSAEAFDRPAENICWARVRSHGRHSKLVT